MDYDSNSVPAKAQSQLDRFEALAERMARCAEALVRPTYSVRLVTPRGSDLLNIVSIRNAGGDVYLTVKLPDNPHTRAKPLLSSDDMQQFGTPGEEH